MGNTVSGYDIALDKSAVDGVKGHKLNEETARPDEQSLPWVHRRLRQDLDVCDWVIEAVYVGGDGFCIPCCQQMGDLPRPRVASIFNKPLSR